ncbi:hypothetical protein BBW65_05285 [Helicobacter enhydrae]|uniref:Uncharacterized protein n=1 Tax=Helicobacter enhydrae TaxID=222136 RepID=A0A1B1U621_9HELI|nr:hypothetical protein [Helicobacter enhydrae]ANV98244.1 hypothetical protein BBW65_05285 [Helicobacter enhydrae]
METKKCAFAKAISKTSKQIKNPPKSVLCQAKKENLGDSRIPKSVLHSSQLAKKSSQILESSKSVLLQKQSQKLANKSRILQRVCFVKPKKRIWEILESPRVCLCQTNLKQKNRIESKALVINIVEGCRSVWGFATEPCELCAMSFVFLCIMLA